MSVADRSIRNGIDIGNSLGQPMLQGGLQFIKQKFEDEQRTKQLADAIKQLTLTNPDIAAGIVGNPTSNTVQGQQAVSPLPLTPSQQEGYDTGKQVQDGGFLNVGGQQFDTAKIQQTGLDDAAKKLDREFQMRSKLAQFESDLKRKEPRTVGAGDTIGNFDENGKFVPSYTTPNPKTAKPLEFKDVGDAVVFLDPFTGEEKGRTPKTKDAKYEKTDRGLLEILPDGTKQIVSGTEPNAAGKPPTETQANFQLYGNRMEQADKDLEKTLSAGYNPSSAQGTKDALIPDWTILNSAKSDQGQNYQQAQRNFINAALRRESGAVISPSEIADARRQYFPQTGDNPSVLAQKKANRQMVISEFKRLGGNAGQPIGSPTEGGGGGQNQNSEAIKWLLDNPTDPRAPEVRKKLGL